MRYLFDKIEKNEINYYKKDEILHNSIIICMRLKYFLILIIISEILILFILPSIYQKSTSSLYPIDYLLTYHCNSRA